MLMKTLPVTADALTLTALTATNGIVFLQNGCILSDELCQDKVL